MEKIKEEYIEKEVHISFDGVVTVRIPKNTENPELLAEKFAVASVVMIEDIDPSVSDSAFRDFCEELGIDDEKTCELKYGKNWDDARIINIRGKYSSK